MSACIAPVHFRPHFGSSACGTGFLPSKLEPARGQCCLLWLCRIVLDLLRCVPAGTDRLRAGSHGPAGNGSPGPSMTDRTRRGTGPEIGPGRENGGIGRGVGRHENALIDGDRRRDAARDHGTARRRGAMSGIVRDHHAGSDRHRGSAHDRSAHRRATTNDGALHHDADSARRRQSRRGANRRAGPCRRWSRPSRRPPWSTAARRSTR